MAIQQLLWKAAGLSAECVVALMPRQSLILDHAEQGFLLNFRQAGVFPGGGSTNYQAGRKSECLCAMWPLDRYVDFGHRDGPQ
jgi:hypothetical protein